MNKFHLGDEEDIRNLYLLDFSKIGKYDLYSLTLIYYDYIGYKNIANNKWNLIQNKTELIEKFVDFTTKYKIIDFKQLSKNEYNVILEYLSEFSINNINNAIDNYIIIKTDLEIVISNLKNENISLQQFEYCDVFKSGINLFKNSLTDVEIYNIFLYFFREKIINIHNDIKDSVIKCIIAMSPLQSSPQIRKYANINLGNDEKGVDIIFIYALLKELRKDEEVKIKDTINELDEMILNNKNKRLPQYNEFKRLLQEGIWIDSIRYAGFNVLRKLEISIGELSNEKQILMSIKNVAKSYLSQNTIMQVLESNSLIAYIIMANTKQGNIMPLIDELKEQDKKNIFWFKKYTTSARIGIIPPSLTFNYFTKYFKEKLPYNSKKYISNIIIHRFPVSEFSSEQLSIGEEYEAPWMIIRDLIYTHVDSKKISTYIKYSVMINESFINKTLYEILRDFLMTLDEHMHNEVKHILDNNNIMFSIFNEFEVNDMKGLLNYIYANQNYKIYKIRFIKVLNEYLYSYDANFVNEFSEFLFNRLLDFGIVANSIKTEVF
jgi:hypothetical protein